MVAMTSEFNRKKTVDFLRELFGSDQNALSTREKLWRWMQEVNYMSIVFIALLIGD